MAIIVGIVLVIWELRQTREITNWQFTHSNITDSSNDLMSLYGESGALVLAKACYNRDNLEKSELVILDSYFRNKILRILKIQFQSEFQAVGPSWKDVSRVYLRDILQFPQGRRFLENFASETGQHALSEYVLEELPTIATKPCNERWDQLGSVPDDS